MFDLNMVVILQINGRKTGGGFNGADYMYIYAAITSAYLRFPGPSI